MKQYRLHLLIFKILHNAVAPFLKLIMDYKCVAVEGPEVPTLIVANHNTNLDPALVAISFSKHMYFVASEHALRKGFGSALLKRFMAPIPINKTQADARAIKDVIRRLRAGHSVCIFAEGNRSYNGVTGPIALSMAKLVKLSGAALMTYRLEGGYFTSPRWSTNMRRGRMRGSLVGNYSPAELKEMTPSQILKIMEQDIYENAYDRQEEKLIHYFGKRLAENIETALYQCPSCKKIGTIYSHGSRFYCECGLSGGYRTTGYLSGKDIPFTTVTQWCQWQEEQLPILIQEAEKNPGKIICRDENQKLYRVEVAKKSILLGEGEMYMSTEDFFCAGISFPLHEIGEFAIVDQMTLLFSDKSGTEYEVRSDEPRSPLKYAELFRVLEENRNRNYYGYGGKT
jgi:1-acyl-sn-glycerol-3-phosphate acyltransferase